MYFQDSELNPNAKLKARWYIYIYKYINPSTMTRREGKYAEKNPLRRELNRTNWF